MIKDGSSYYYHADGLGSIVAITDSSQTIVQHYDYGTFGQLTASDDFNNSYTFTGREWDEELGLHYYRARYYDAQTGRFISKDPIGFAGGDMNVYRYVGNGPVNLTDSIGLAPDWFSCWASCIEKHRADPVAALAALGSALPKRTVPPFRVVNQNQRFTTPLSSSAHFLRKKAPGLASKMRWAGRGISKVATPLTIVEGVWDIGVIVYCGETCKRDEPCQN